MNENQFEGIICDYPDLVEDGLKFVGRQVSVGGKLVDILFEDRHAQKLVIELKVGPILRKHIGQLMDYEGYFLSAETPTVRVMLVGNRVPVNFRKVLDHHGFEWKEITFSALVDHLKKHNDVDWLAILGEEEVATPHFHDCTQRTDTHKINKSRIKLPRLQDVSSFEELQATIRTRANEVVTNYMDLLLLENAQKTLSCILQEFQQYAIPREYKAFLTLSYLRAHIKYRESKGWIFEYSRDGIDPVVRLIGFKKS